MSYMSLNRIVFDMSRKFILSAEVWICVANIYGLDNYFEKDRYLHNWLSSAPGHV